MLSAERLDAAYAHCEAELAQGDRDRWLADLFLPRAVRRHAHAIHAFSLEAARIRETVNAALPGEIRLQWWIDAIEGEARGDVAGHPVAAALIDTIRRFSLRREGFVNLLEARRFDLYDDVWPTMTDLEGYAGETASVLFQQVATVLVDGEDGGTAEASGHAGVTYAITGLLRAFPMHARRNQVFVPADVLRAHEVSADDIRAGRNSAGLSSALAGMRAAAAHHLELALAALAGIDPRAKPAFASLGLVRPYLGALDRGDPFAGVADLASWRKPLALWLFARRL